MKKWIIIVIVVIVVGVIGVLYLQLPFGPAMTITYNGKTYQPNITICDWRTNSYDSKNVKMYWEMLEKEDPIFVTKSWEKIQITTSSQLGLSTIEYSDKEKVFVQIIGNAHIMKDIYPISEKEVKDNVTANLTARDFNLEIKLLDQGYYAYAVAAHYNAGMCSYYFKIKIE